MAVLGSLEVDRLGKIELLDNNAGAEVEVVADDLDELVRVLLRGAVGVDVDGEGLSNTNGVGELDQSTAGKTGSDEGLGDPAADVGGRAIDLGEILARESTTTVSAPSTVGVDDDLATSQTGITLRATDDKEARGLDLVSVSNKPNVGRVLA